jgi:hypothetical protein
VVAGLTAEDGTVRFLPRVRVQIVKGTCPTDNAGAKVAAAAEGETSLHGELIVALPQGAYHLCAADTTTQKHYRWNLPLDAKGKPLTVELSDANALQASISTPSNSVGGVIEGDVYLLMKSGDVRKGAGLTVQLIRDPERVSGLLTANCEQFHRRYEDLDRREKEARDAQLKVWLSPEGDRLGAEGNRLHKETYELFDGTTASANRTLLGASMTSTSSGATSHFKFDDVPAGLYGLWAQFPIADNWYQWFIPVRLAAGQHLVRDLDTDSMNRDVVYCGIK